MLRMSGKHTSESEQEAPVYKSNVTLEELPYLPLMKILSYLDPKSLIACSNTCLTLNSVVRSGPLWKVLCPLVWARSIWTWGPCDLTIEQLIFHKVPIPCMKIFYADTYRKHYSPGQVMDYSFLFRILSGLTPAVGPYVRELYMNQSDGVTDVLVRVALVQCPNLEILSLKSTPVTDDAFQLLPDYNACRKLLVLDLSETLIGNGALAALVACWTPEDSVEQGTIVAEERDAFRIPLLELRMALQPLDMVLNYTTDEERDDAHMLKTFPITTYRGTGRGKVQGIRKLNLSCCTRLTDPGLSALSESRALVNNLQWLDVSGTNITGKALCRFVSQCSNLKPENLYYCDHIDDGPYKQEANGCSNLQGKKCCVVPEYY